MYISANFSPTVEHAQEAYKALPPEHQISREVKAIKEDPRLVDRIGNSLYNLQKNEEGYLVTTDWCTVQVHVIYLPREGDICGPARFELSFDDAIEIFPTILH